jgi:hypothetical protein
MVSVPENCLTENCLPNMKGSFASARPVTRVLIPEFPASGYSPFSFSPFSANSASGGGFPADNYPVPPLV